MRTVADISFFESLGSSGAGCSHVWNSSSTPSVSVFNDVYVENGFFGATKNVLKALTSLLGTGASGIGTYLLLTYLLGGAFPGSPELLRRVLAGSGAGLASTTAAEVFSRLFSSHDKNANGVARVSDSTTAIDQASKGQKPIPAST